MHHVHVEHLALTKFFQEAQDAFRVALALATVPAGEETKKRARVCTAKKGAHKLQALEQIAFFALFMNIFVDDDSAEARQEMIRYLQSMVL